LLKYSNTKTRQPKNEKEPAERHLISFAENCSNKRSQLCVPLGKIVNANSGSHLLATFGAVAARVHAIFHFADPLTIRGTLCADLGGRATGAFVKFRADQHDVRGCSTDLGANHDQAEVLGFGMLTAELQTMSHRRRQARAGLHARTIYSTRFFCQAVTRIAFYLAGGTTT
jgi:hypothetical protein